MSHGTHEHGSSHDSHSGTSSGGGGFWQESGTYLFNPLQILSDTISMIKPSEAAKGIESVAGKAGEFSHDMVKGGIGGAVPPAADGGGSHGGGGHHEH